MFKNLTNSIKEHLFSIITAVVIAVVVCGYILLMLPRQTAKADQTNKAVFASIKQQFSDYIDDRVKTLNYKGVKQQGDTFRFSDTVSPEFSAGAIRITGAKSVADSLPSALLINRQVSIRKNNVVVGVVKDSVTIDLSDFRNKIPEITNFSSIYICQVWPKNSDSLHPLFAENVSLQDQDSLWHHRRGNGPFAFKDSSKRYYADQLDIPGGNYSIYLAAGVSQSFFQSAVRAINPRLLMFTLSLVIILMLSIAFIKPVVSSYKERLYQKDLISVVFSIGALSAVIVVFCMVTSWDNALKNDNNADLKKLVEHIDTSFKKQFTVYECISKTIFGRQPDDSLHAKLLLNDHGKLSTLSGNDTVVAKTDSVKGLFYIPKEKTIYNDSLYKYLDAYFRMDKYGLITTDLNKNKPTLARTYADRDYFKAVTKSKDKNNSILRAVFSRDDNAYQWVFAQKDPQNASGIQGFAFRNKFTDILKMPPGTDYLIIDKNGGVLMQSDPQKSLYQNLLRQTKKNNNLQNALAGNYTGSFTMEYQGTSYQAYAKRLDVASSLPVYILGIRDLTFAERLSIYTFSNSFLIALAYGIFVLVLMLFYSALMHAGSAKFFSRKHFYYLFPNNSRTYEYKTLFIFNVISIFITIGLALLISPPAAFASGITIGINTAFVNFLVLNPRRTKSSKHLIIVLVLALSASSAATIFLIKSGHGFWGMLLLFAVHCLFISIYRSLKKEVPRENLIDKNKGVNRRAYTRFITAVLLNHFAVFPFVLCSVIYVTELNDFSTWHCSANQKENNPAACIIPANGCGCDSAGKETYNENEASVRLADLHILPRPTVYEVGKFSLVKIIKGYYVRPTAAFEPKTILLLVLGLFLLYFLTYAMVNYYGNRFFFYDLMQAFYKKFYTGRHRAAMLPALIAFPDESTIANLVEKGDPDQPANRVGTTIEAVFKDAGNEIPVLERKNFIVQYNLAEFSGYYEEIWDDISPEEHNILFDFARDNFVNYKNKNMIMQLMEEGIIDCDIVTGRLKIMNPSFGKYIVLKNKNDETFIKEFEKESQGGFFSKLKLPIIIIAVSTLVLLMYLNKDSYDKVALLGTGITSALALVHKLLGFNKSS